MICAACGEPTAAAPCEGCGADPLVRGEWRLDRVLGTGAGGTTWAGTRLADGRVAALKEGRGGTKDRELARREARVLREVSHPQLPRYYDAFVLGTGKSSTSWLVLELVDGVDLETESATRRYTEAEVRDVIRGLVPVLAYLHGLSPPVVHRDLKPRNVLRRKDGTLVLLDFGVARDDIPDAHGGTTVAGTFGYMAPEQFHGDASPATDVYGLGALALALLSRKDPSRLAGPTGGLAWEGAVRVSDATRRLLRGMLAPDPKQRIADTAALLRALDGELPTEPTTQPWGVVVAVFLLAAAAMIVLAW